MIREREREREGREGTRGTASKQSWGAPLIIATPDIMPGFKSTGSEVVEGRRKKKRCKSGPTTHSPVTALVPRCLNYPFVLCVHLSDKKDEPIIMAFMTCQLKSNNIPFVM